MNIIGNIEGRDCVLFDDIVDSGGTLCNAADALLEKAPVPCRPTSPTACCQGGAVARVTASQLKELVITDTIEATSAVRAAHNIRVVSVAGLLGEAIRRTALEKSVSSLFD